MTNQEVMALTAVLRNALPAPRHITSRADEVGDGDTDGASMVPVEEVMKALDMDDLGVTVEQLQRALEVACSKEYAALPAEQQWIRPLCCLVEEGAEYIGYRVAM